MLRMDDLAYTEEFRIVLHRLHQAMSEEEIRQKMIVEDEIVTEFEERDRREQRLADLAGEERRLREEERHLKEEALLRATEARTREEDTRRREQVERLLREDAVQREQAALAELAELKRRLERMEK